MTTHRDQAAPRFFAVTSPGLSATRWLSFVLAAHPKVFVAHGKHKLDAVMCGDFSREREEAHRESVERGNDLLEFYETQPVEAVFTRYREAKPDAAAFGCVHTYTLQSLIRSVGSPGTLASIRVWNLLRHPVSFIASHEALVRSAESHPPLYQQYTDRVFPQALAWFPELYLTPCPDLKAFFTFAVSCFGVTNLLADLTYFPGFHHVRMESLTTNVDLLKTICEELTGLRYPQEWLEPFIQGGGINTHRGSGSLREPADLFASWEPWKRDVAAVMLPETVLVRLEEQGYDVSMLRSPPATAISACGNPPSCLADQLRVIDPAHPWLVNLNRPSPSLIQEVEARYQGFRLAKCGGRFYGVAGTSGIREPDKVSPEILLALEESGSCLSADSHEELLCLIDAHTFNTPTQHDEYKGYNLVRWNRRVFAVAKTLGPLDLTRTSVKQRAELTARREVIEGPTAEAVRIQINRFRPARENLGGFVRRVFRRLRGR